MKIIYRISDTGYNKVKPDYINNEKTTGGLYNNCSNISFGQLKNINEVE